jgi:acyl-CoA synthetase (AMP-forming)/AMP-acid ligase II
MSSHHFSRTPAFGNVADYPAHWARVRPDAEAIVEVDRTFSYRALDSAIDDAARAMLASGVARGDRVAMLSTTRAEQFILFFAAARIGAIWLGLNPRHQLEEFAHVLGDAQPKLVVALLDIEGRSYRSELMKLQAGWLTDTRIISLQAEPESSANGFVAWSSFIEAGRATSVCVLEEAKTLVEPTDTALIVYTSGSTGKPKGAMLSHESIITTCRIECEHWWAEPFRTLNNGPINHIGGTVQVSGQAFIAGGTNVLLPRFDPVSLPQVIREKKVTVLHQVPTMYQMMLERGKPSLADFSSVQVLIWSGAPAPLSLIQHLRKLCPNLFTSYGMTETGGEVLYSLAGATDDLLALCVGQPDPRIPLRLGDLDGRGPAAGNSGEVQIQGVTGMCGYFGLPEATKNAFTPDGWLRTGDIAERRDDGNFRITGRLREMYKSGGYNIYPREVELVLEQHPGVAMAAVVGLADEVYGEIGHAWVLSSNPQLEASELEAWCRARLANYKTPKRIHVRDELPMLPIHKLDKVVLRQWSQSLK